MLSACRPLRHCHPSTQQRPRCNVGVGDCLRTSEKSHGELRIAVEEVERYRDYLARQVAEVVKPRPLVGWAPLTALIAGKDY